MMLLTAGNNHLSQVPSSNINPSTPNPRILVTMGEPAGIGPELCLRLASHKISASSEIVVLGSKQVLLEWQQHRGLPADIVPYQKNTATSGGISGGISGGTISVLEVPRYPNGGFDGYPNEGVVFGEPNQNTAQWQLDLLKTSVSLVQKGEFDAVVNCPIDKKIISCADPTFIGHTEFYGRSCNAKTLMLLENGSERVAMVTTHCPLSEVSSQITKARLTEAIEILHAGLISCYQCVKPKILVAGINPHAGEQGLLGSEEDEVIIPVLQACQKQGMDISGPHAADTIFGKATKQGADAILSMFHDQSLPALKALSFGKVVNVTLGLPLIRVSVDHGTAYDLARGNTLADNASFHLAIQRARSLGCYQGNY